MGVYPTSAVCNFTRPKRRNGRNALERGDRSGGENLEWAYISMPMPTMGTKSWSTEPYFVPGAGVMICLGNAVM